jgi:hypothetical protein
VVIDPATDSVTTISNNGFFSRPSPSGDAVAVRVGHIGGSTGILPIGGGVVRPLAPGSPVDWSSDGSSLTISESSMDVSVCDVTTGLVRLAVIGNEAEGWSVSPGVWSPTARQFVVMVWSYAGHYTP